MTIVGIDGKPLGDDAQKCDEFQLDRATQAFIKAEVNTHMDGVRATVEEMRRTSITAADDKKSKSKIRYAVGLITALVLYFVGMEKIENWTELFTKKYVDWKLDQRMMIVAADTIMTNKVLPYVTAQLQTTKAGVVDLSCRLDENTAKASRLSDSVALTQLTVSNLLFSVQNRQRELFVFTDTNRMVIAEKEGGGVYVFLRLSQVPIHGSVDIVVVNYEDRPDASRELVGNIYIASYEKGAFDKLKGSSVMAKYYPAIDQSGGSVELSVTTNNEVLTGKVRFQEIFKRIARP